MDKTIEQKYDVLLGAIFAAWYDCRSDFELTRSAASGATASYLMRILSATSTVDDMLDFILEKQQLRFEAE